MPHQSPRPRVPRSRRLIACAFVCAMVLPAASWAVDWGKTAAAEVSLFYPGQMSWEKVLTASSHKGATKFRAGETCHDCHRDEEAEMGASQAQLTGFAGRNAVTVQLRAAVQGDSLHLQMSGPAVDGKAPSVAIMLGNEALKSTAQAGCWAACHDDAPGMASDSGQKLGKYLPRSRSRNTATGGGDSVRPQAELDVALAAGEFLDVLEIEASGTGERGHVLDKLHMGELVGAASMRIENGRWVAEIQRPLQAAGSGQIALEAGKVYHLGIALHDPGSEGRDHLVSLARSLSIGSGSADIVAASQ